MQQGAYISGLAHAGLILWALLAGLFLRAGDPITVQTMDVSVLTAEEFAALTAPPEPELPQPEAVVEPAPVELPAAEPDAAPELPAAEPEAEVAPEPAPTPEPPAPAPVEAIPDQPIIPDAPPSPPEADRVAPDVAPAPPEDAEIAPETTPEVAPSDTAEVVTEEAPATAPEEAATEIVTEADTPSTAAPVQSLRPMARPANLRPPAASPTPQPETTEPEAPRDAIAEALAQAAAETPAPRAAPSGPPLTGGERDGFRLAVQECWVVDVGSQAANVTVTVGFSLDQSGKVTGDISLISAEGGEGPAVNTAFAAARRAILRCQKGGFPLPRDKYDHWRDVEMTFNPKNMRIK